MTTWDRCCTLLAGSLLPASLSALPKPPSSLPAWRVYGSALSRTCPAEHRERLSSENLNYLAGHFTDRLPPAEQRAIKSSVVRSCSARDAGKECELDGFVIAAAQLGEIDRFAAQVCTNPLQTEAVRSSHW